MPLRTYVLLLILICVGSAPMLAQTSTAKDTAHVDSAYVKMYPGLYDKAWCQKFTELWNSNKDTAKLLGGMGKVYFASVSGDTQCALMNFDSLGQASVLKLMKGSPGDSLPIFTSKLALWADFMEGKFNAFAGVLSGKIKYKGPLPLAFKYGQAFNRVAPVGKRASQFVSQKRKK